MNYQQIYTQLISRGQRRIVEKHVYVEAHHIIPKCIGGSDELTNIVKLTPEEHLVAHLLLVKIHPASSKLVYAANWMKSRVKNNKEYGWVKRRFSQIEKQSKTGIKRSKESIEKQRETILQKYKSGYISPQLGKHLSDQHKTAISTSNIGKTVPIAARSSLEGFILRYGHEVGTENYLKNNEKKKSNSLDAYIKKYGEISGLAQYTNRANLLSLKMSGENNSFYGKKHSNKSRKRISDSNTGRSKVRTTEHNKKIGQANRGRKHESITCPYCNKVGGGSIMKRWHFEHCRF